MANVIPHATLVQALHSPELIRLLPELQRYAEHRLRTLGLLARDTASAAVQAEDVLQNAVECALRGTRPWAEGMDLRTYLRGVMWSWVDYMLRQARRRQAVNIDDFVGMAAPSSRRNDRIDARGVVADLLSEIDGDDDAEALCVVIADNEKKMTREEQAEALGWTLARVRAAHARLRRRFDAVRLRRTGQDDENPQRDRSARDPASPGERAR